MVDTVLASTLHDPENRLEELIVRCNTILKGAFESCNIAVTPSTHRKTIRILGNLGFHTFSGTKSISGIYREALEKAETIDSKQIFYCDFDRILHWAKTYPNELKNTPNSHPSHDFLLIGRTPRAFGTHPETQTMTENIANQIASKILGFNKTRDIISACWRLTLRLTEKLLELPAKNACGFYCEWPITAWRLAENPGYLEVEGLEWETPDRYQKEIMGNGYERWLEELQTSKEWKKRVKLLRDTIESMCMHGMEFHTLVDVKKFRKIDARAHIHAMEKNDAE